MTPTQKGWRVEPIILTHDAMCSEEQLRAAIDRVKRNKPRSVNVGEVRATVQTLTAHLADNSNAIYDRAVVRWYTVPKQPSIPQNFSFLEVALKEGRGRNLAHVVARIVGNELKDIEIVRYPWELPVRREIPQALRYFFRHNFQRALAWISRHPAPPL